MRSPLAGSLLADALLTAVFAQIPVVLIMVVLSLLRVEKLIFYGGDTSNNSPGVKYILKSTATQLSFSCSSSLSTSPEGMQAMTPDPSDSVPRNPSSKLCTACESSSAPFGVLAQQLICTILACVALTPCKLMKYSGEMTCRTITG